MFNSAHSHLQNKEYWRSLNCNPRKCNCGWNIYQCWPAQQLSWRTQAQLSSAGCLIIEVFRLDSSSDFRTNLWTFMFFRHQQLSLNQTWTFILDKITCGSSDASGYQLSCFKQADIRDFKRCIIYLIRYQSMTCICFLYILRICKYSIHYCTLQTLFTRYISK